MVLRSTIVPLAVLSVLALLGTTPSQAFPAVAGYCNSYAADQAAGRPGGAYGVEREGVYMHAFRFCMDAHDTPLDVAFMKFGDEALHEAAAEAHVDGSNYHSASDRHAYCAAKYRSYNPATGLYRTYSGRWKPCR
ncbi:MAG: BA14K family protein [Parvibaculaceae bacterium]